MSSLQTKYDFVLDPATFDAYVDRELGKVIEKLEKEAEPLPGVIDQIEKLDKAKYKIAVVSSSAHSRVAASLKKVGLASYFPDDLIFSAATSLPKPTSKPDPAVYLFACEKLGVKPGECVAIEDSKSGAKAATNAKIPLIGFVGPYEGEEREEMTKLLTEECGALVVMNHWSEFQDCLKKVEAA